MTVPALLVALAMGVAILAPRLLLRRGWTRRSPRTGILAWQAAVLTVLASGVLLAVAAVLPVERVWLDLGHVLHACPEVLRGRYAAFDGSWLRLASLAAAVATLLSLVRATTLRGMAVRRGRVRQRELLAVLARHRDARYAAHVLEHDTPLAYCVPGDGGRVVVTTATVQALDERQLAAVLAHEHAHLDGRHDLVLFGAEVATAAFPWSRFFRTARRELSLLVEMAADDEAVRRSDATTLASALVDLGQRLAPAGALGATGDSLERVRRLLDAPPVLGRGARLTVMGMSLLLIAAPWAIAVVPAWAARLGYCPLPDA